MAAEVGHSELAYDYLAETAFIDLRDHLASLAGSWLVAVAGFGGMGHHGTTLEFSPRLRSRLDELPARLPRPTAVRSVSRGNARCELLEGDAFEISHHGEPPLGLRDRRAAPDARDGPIEQTLTRRGSARTITVMGATR